MDVAGQLHEDAEIGQGSLFGGAAAAKGGAAGAEALLTLRPVKPWTPMERLQHEFEAVGFYLSGHPLDQYERLRLKLGAMRWSEFEAATERGVTAGRLALLDFQLQRISSADGPFVRKLGDLLRDDIEREINERQPRLVEKMNRSLEKHQDELRISVRELLASGWNRFVNVPPKPSK